VLSVLATPAELDVVLTLMRVSGWPSYANLLRHALWLTARHFDVPTAPGVFAPRREP
jgi:hypothetical protein